MGAGQRQIGTLKKLIRMTGMVSRHIYLSIGLHSVRHFILDMFYFIESTVPSMPTSLRVRAMTNSIIVSWTPPIEDNILVRGYILGYGIGLPDVYKQVLEAKDRMHTIINLRK